MLILAAVSFPFPGGDRASQLESGREEHTWDEQKIGEKWGGVNEKGEGVHRKGVREVMGSIPVGNPDVFFVPCTLVSYVMLINSPLNFQM